MIIFVVSILMTYIIIANNRKKVKSNTDEPNKNNPNTDASDQISSDDKKSKKVVPIKLPNGNEQNREQISGDNKGEGRKGSRPPSGAKGENEQNQEQISGDNKEKDEKEVGHQVEPKGNEQNQEQISIVGAKVLTGVGATLAGGSFAGVGTYVVNKVIERGKSSKVGPKDVNDEYVHLDSDGNSSNKNKGS